MCEKFKVENYSSALSNFILYEKLYRTSKFYYFLLYIIIYWELFFRQNRKAFQLINTNY